MLDVFAYPVSVLMKFWHDVLGLILDPGSGVAWVTSIFLLVCTVRTLLLLPMWKQLVSARRMAALRPRMLELKRIHDGDQAAYVSAARQLQKDEGVGMVGFLPMLLQIPVFLGLYHLLGGFTAIGTRANGVFDSDEVHSFAHATVGRVPLAAAIRTPTEILSALQPGLGLIDVLVVVVPLLLLAAAATLVNVYSAARRQAAAPIEADNPLSEIGGRLSRTMIWLAPISVLAGGVMLPVPLALVLYWAINGTWTTVQTMIMNNRLDRRT